MKKTSYLANLHVFWNKKERKKMTTLIKPNHHAWRPHPRCMHSEKQPIYTIWMCTSRLLVPSRCTLPEKSEVFVANEGKSSAQHEYTIGCCVLENAKCIWKTNQVSGISGGRKSYRIKNCSYKLREAYFNHSKLILHQNFGKICSYLSIILKF